jgi:hypothetical protein
MNQTKDIGLTRKKKTKNRLNLSKTQQLKNFGRNISKPRKNKHEEHK